MDLRWRCLAVTEGLDSVPYVLLILVVAFLFPAEERSSTASGKSSFRERESFNGRNILKLFESFSFGEAQLDAVLLSQRYSSDASGYYGTAGRLALR
ncbi:UNVERIFIED_CONTAM: hypothetical protein H355_001521 [Colinus virginianus]|nr:hypothetical protein H355_001521 [Colinus virginianus]